MNQKDIARTYFTGSTGARSALAWMHKVVLSLLLVATAFTASAAGPDTTARSFIKVENPLFLRPILTEHTVLYAPPTAAVSGTWSVVGSGEPGYTATEINFLGIQTRFDYVVNPVIVTGPFNGGPYETHYLTPAPITDAVEKFGTSLGIQGSMLAVASSEVIESQSFHSESIIGSGRVHLYLHNGTTFVHDSTIIHGGLEERFGQSLSLIPSLMLVGRPGAVPGAADLFDPGTGAHIASLSSPGSSDNYGETVALLPDLAFVGASGTGVVYVYRHDGAGNWNTAGTLDSPGSGSEFGAAIAVSGNRVLVGAPGVDRAYVFEDDGDSVWPVVAEIAGGNDTRLGTAVALTGDAAFVSASALPIGGALLGVVNRYERAPDGSWPFISFKLARSPEDGDGFGNIISASAGALSVVQNGVNHRPSEFYIYTAQAAIYDSDSDTLSNYGDNCADVYNPGQEDFDGDEIGDACDPDNDNDGLTNAEEAIIGSDPFDPDSDDDGLIDSEDPYPLFADGDGDGTDDPDDNCPEIANADQANLDGDDYGDLCDLDIDGDGLSNDDEVPLGTDPYNVDTDGDVHTDGSDFWPLDAKDGWAKKYRLQVEADAMLLGDDVLLTKTDQGSSDLLRSFSAVEGDWVEIAAPSVVGNPNLTLCNGGARGNRFIALDLDVAGGVVIPRFHYFEWFADAGWAQYGPISTIVDYHRLESCAVGDDVVVVLVYKYGYQALIYDIEPTGLSFRSSHSSPGISGGSYIAIAGNYLLNVNILDDVVEAYDLEDDFSVQLVDLPAGVQELQPGPFRVGPAKALVDYIGGSFWLTLGGGIWSAAPTGIPKWSPLTDHVSGGNGAVVVVDLDLDPSENSDYALYGVLRASDESEVGKFNKWGYQGYSRIATNGGVVVQALQTSGSIPVVDVFVIPPPGC
ncbi:MAG: hypothetical protein ACI9JM_000832 [Halioglobus sp.]|jgi:hypothetical protein